MVRKKLKLFLVTILVLSFFTLQTVQIFASDTPTYTVIFDSTGGTFVPPYENITEGSTVPFPKRPSKIGCCFDGWYLDEELTERWIFSMDTVNKNMTLYAKWSYH